MDGLILLPLALVLTSPAGFLLNGLHFLDLTSAQSLRTLQLPRGERTALAHTIAEQLRPSMRVLGITSEKQLDQVASDARIKMADLNDEGSAEVIVQGLDERAGCSPTGNCPFWIFQRTEGGYTLMLQRGAVQRFAIASTRSHGFHDIVTAIHGSATEGTLRIFKYDGRKYRFAACYNESWSLLEGATVRPLKEPQLTPCGEPRVNSDLKP